MTKQRKFYQHYNIGDVIYDNYEGRTLTVKGCSEHGRAYLCSVTEEDEDGIEIEKEDQRTVTYGSISIGGGRVREISRQELGIRSGDPHYVIMKRTAFGDIDINSYHDTFKDAIEEMMDLPLPCNDYNIYKIRR